MFQICSSQSPPLCTICSQHPVLQPVLRAPKLPSQALEYLLRVRNTCTHNKSRTIHIVDQSHANAGPNRSTPFQSRLPPLILLLLVLCPDLVQRNPRTSLSVTRHRQTPPSRPDITATQLVKHVAPHRALRAILRLNNSTLDHTMHKRRLLIKNRVPVTIPTAPAPSPPQLHAHPQSHRTPAAEYPQPHLLMPIPHLRHQRKYRRALLQPVTPRIRTLHIQQRAALDAIRSAAATLSTCTHTRLRKGGGLTGGFDR